VGPAPAIRTSGSDSMSRMVARRRARFHPRNWGCRLEKGGEVETKLMAMANRSMKNWNGMHVGDVRVTDALFA